jgi:hypothetical protein
VSNSRASRGQEEGLLPLYQGSISGDAAQNTQTEPGVHLLPNLLVRHEVQSVVPAHDNCWQFITAVTRDWMPRTLTRGDYVGSNPIGGDSVAPVVKLDTRRSTKPLQASSNLVWGFGTRPDRLSLHSLLRKRCGFESHSLTSVRDSSTGRALTAWSTCAGRSLLPVTGLHTEHWLADVRVVSIRKDLLDFL